MIDNRANNHLARVEQAIRAFREVQSKWSDQGACDTEPDLVWQVLIDKAACGRKPKVPTDSESWQLFHYYPDEPEYSDCEDCDPEMNTKSAAAALELAAAAIHAIKVIREVPGGHDSPVLELVKSFCWRLTYDGKRVRYKP